ncbi:MAG TPA: hypothetical protein [Caudoviricetes sp.]|nr:MAG TPA: hypothetical protein [Caudoviricetes sp.]
MDPEYEPQCSSPAVQYIAQVAIILNYRIFMSELLFPNI